MAQIRAAEAVFAALEIGGKEAVIAVVAILQPRAVVAVAGVDAFVAEFAPMHAQTVAAVLAGVDAARVVTVFVLLGLADQVAVLGFAAAVGVLRVHIPLRIHEQIEMRNFVAKFFELFEERPREIEISGVLEWIPFVAQPFGNVVDRKCRASWMHRDHRAARKITRAMIKFALIAERESSLPATRRTECRCRNLHRLPTNRWCNLRVERAVHFREREGGFALPTGDGTCGHEKIWKITI